MTRFLIGIDEVGRGPLAGPVTVGGVLMERTFDPVSHLVGMKESKLLTATRRESFFRDIQDLERQGVVRYSVSSVSATVIDRVGIQRAIRIALKRVVDRLTTETGDVHIFLDGGLKAPARFSQETVIKGDLTVPAIALASIAAKVTRDRRMERYARKFPQYGFEKHKGYGTERHREAIIAHGMSALHRRTFCRGVIARDR